MLLVAASVGPYLVNAFKDSPIDKLDFAELYTLIICLQWPE